MSSISTPSELGFPEASVAMAERGRSSPSCSMPFALRCSGSAVFHGANQDVSAPAGAPGDNPDRAAVNGRSAFRRFGARARAERAAGKGVTSYRKAKVLGLRHQVTVDISSRPRVHDRRTLGFNPKFVLARAISPSVSGAKCLRALANCVHRAGLPRRGRM